MTLTLAAPDANPIRTYSNGLKVVRLTDYIGAARGTLTTVADSAAVAGTVVKDTQTVAIQTTFANKFTSVADTITIPVADFNYPPESGYTGYLAIRCEGRPPVTARAGEDFNTWFNNSTPNVALGWDGVEQVAAKVPREHYACYQMVQLGGFGPQWDGFSSTNVNIRAWGIAGGATTFAWYLDCLYLIPSSLADTDTGASFLAGTYQWFIGQESIDPTLPATDVDANTQLGERSVFTHFQDSVINEGGGFDIQDSDGENTESDWHPFWFGSDTNKELSYIYWVGLCSRLINAHTLVDDEDFAGSGADPSGPSVPPSAFDFTWTTDEGYQIYGAFTGETGKMYFADGVARYRTYSETWSEVPISFYPLDANAQDKWDIGAWTHNLDSFSATDPRTYLPRIANLESFIWTLKCIPTNGIPPQGLNYWLYGTRWTGENTFIDRVTFGPRIYIEATGDATVQFETQPDNFGGLPTTVVGDTENVPDNLGTAFWVKIERKLYVWRVKIWSDGDAEPNDWLLETNQPANFYNTLSSSHVLPYPWDTGYPVGGTTFEVDAPNHVPGGTGFGGAGIAAAQGWSLGGQIELYTGFNEDLPGWRWDIDNITIEYDPDSDNEGDYTSAHFRLEKYDGSVQWGQVEVDPGMCRVAFSDYAPHHFDNSTHGGNISAWKEAGGHPLQTAAYSTMIFRRYVQGDIPLFRPRVFSVRDF